MGESQKKTLAAITGGTSGKVLRIIPEGTPNEILEKHLKVAQKKLLGMHHKELLKESEKEFLKELKKMKNSRRKLLKTIT